MIRIGTRGSALALWQAKHIQKLIEKITIEPIEIIIIKTQGDVVRHLSLDKLEGKGFFTKELEVALIEKKIDLAVHSLKDLPTELPDELCIAAIVGRESANDCLLIKNDSVDSKEAFFPIKRNAKIGSSSNRRIAQLYSKRPDLIPETLRGNVPTRIEKLLNGLYDGIIIAKAGIVRLDIEEKSFIKHDINLDEWPTAPGQGALAIETLSDNNNLKELLLKIHQENIEKEISLERNLLSNLGGGCHLPLGAFAKKISEQNYCFTFFLAKNNPSLDGKTTWTFFNKQIVGESLDKLLLDSTLLSKNFLNNTLNEINDSSTIVGKNIETTNVCESEKSDRPLRGKNILITRPKESNKALSDEIESLGGKVLSLPTIRYENAISTYSKNSTENFFNAVLSLQENDWVLFSSSYSVKIFFELLKNFELSLPKDINFAGIGTTTLSAIKSAGYDVSLVPDEAVSEAFFWAFDKLNSDKIKKPKVLLPMAENGRTFLYNSLVEKSYDAEKLFLYKTVAVDTSNIIDLSVIHVDYIVFMSPSSVESFSKSHNWPEMSESISIGPTTSDCMHKLGIPVHNEAVPHNTDGIISILLKKAARSCS